MRRFSNWKKYQCQGQIFFLYIKWARYAFTPLHASHSVKRFTRSPSCSFDVSHGSIVMEFIWAFSTGDRCAIYGLKPFFLGGPWESHAPAWLFIVVFFFFFFNAYIPESQNHAQCFKSLGGVQND